MDYVVLLALLPRGFGSDVRLRTGSHYTCRGHIEAVRKCCVGGVGVFDSIMKQLGDHLVFRPPTLAHDGRHTQEVGDIGDTRPLANLVAVHIDCVQQGVVETLAIRHGLYPAVSVSGCPPSSAAPPILRYSSLPRTLSQE